MSTNYAIPLQSGGGNDNYKDLGVDLGLALGTAVRYDGANWIASDLATANTANSDATLAFAVVVGNVTTTKISSGGLVNMNDLNGAAHGFTVGSVYFEANAGANTTVAPTDGWNNALFIPMDADCVHVVSDTRAFYTDPKANQTALSIERTQAAHGFALMDQVYLDNTGWAFGDTSAAATIPTHTVVEVIDANTFCVQSDGYATIAHGIGGTAGEDYFATNSGATGNYSATEPAVSGEFSQPAFQIIDGNNVLILTGKRAYEIA